ncbi:UDP-N-acetylglucosamine transporter UGNT1 [Dendrobium catenatum]|uniref:UDP-N-acetylglucosamine transporter UGNT1 n=1 Tax=Dendrobium catenatum TaxID=906689 RepID=UPI00109F528B|nr:UDP-N-acetylglucosamine transporter UGNT1 [Dendrobium catenatum]
MAPFVQEKSLLLPVVDPPRSGDESLFKGSGMTKRGAYAALSYMLCAVLLVMFNKAALSSYNFPSANVITLSQMICSTSLLYVLRRWKIITFSVGDLWSSTDSGNFVPPKTLLHTLPLSLAYLLYMLAGMESVRGVNVPMYTTLRRTTVVFTMIVEYLLIGQKYTLSIVGSVALIVFGAFVAGARDLSFDTYGYAIVFLSNITTAIYLATISRIGKSSGLNTFGLMWCNGLVCTPILLFWTLVRGDLELTISFPYLYSTGFQNPRHYRKSLITNGFCRRLTHVFRRLCKRPMTFRRFSNRRKKRRRKPLPAVFFRRFLSPTVFRRFVPPVIAVVFTGGSPAVRPLCDVLVQDLFTIGLGWLLFGGLPFDLLNVIGQALGFVGSGLYAYLKIKGK